MRYRLTGKVVRLVQIVDSTTAKAYTVPNVEVFGG